MSRRPVSRQVGLGELHKIIKLFAHTFNVWPVASASGWLTGVFLHSPIFLTDLKSRFQELGVFNDIPVQFFALLSARRGVSVNLRMVGPGVVA